jgi:hypothetical protein
MCIAEVVVSLMPGPYLVPTYRGQVRAVAICKAPTGPTGWGVPGLPPGLACAL